MLNDSFIEIAAQLSKSGLIWQPEIGDEIAIRPDLRQISILVDPHGLSPSQLRGEYLWLPTVEQLVDQIEARQALIFHVGVNDRMFYEAVIRKGGSTVEACEVNLRLAFGKALYYILTDKMCLSRTH